MEEPEEKLTRSLSAPVASQSSTLSALLFRPETYSSRKEPGARGRLPEVMLSGILATTAPVLLFRVHPERSAG